MENTIVLYFVYNYWQISIAILKKDLAALSGQTITHHSERNMWAHISKSEACSE